ncbi:MAG: hypothetical protein IPM13_08465 [Phycisphaerales bacterium]|nr:hypothetical protein [Phycisphaerales bacterium]
MSRRVVLGADVPSGLRGEKALLVQLLERSPADHPPPGTWERLSKPGLAGRERWRWTRDDETQLYVKRYTRTPLRQQFDRVLRQDRRGSRAAWEFEVGRRLALAGVAAAPVVGYAEEMVGPWERRSVVVLGAVPGEALDRAWPGLVAAGSPVTRGAGRHRAARELAAFVAAFHAAGLCHRDLYLCHIFMRIDSPGDKAPGFTLIDLARVFAPKLRRWRWIIKDLGQLDASAQQLGLTRTDRLRFLRAYLGGRAARAGLRAYVDAIVAKSRAILARMARKGRAR